MDLIEAAKQGDITVVRDALEKGDDINAKDSSGWTALILAAENGHTEIVKLLIEKGADVNAKNDNGITALMFAANVEIARLLIEHGADINAKNDFGNTAVMLASERGNTETVKLFKEKGAVGPSSGLSMASLITGILSIFPPLSLQCGIAAIVCGTIDIKRIKRESSYIEGEKFDRIGIITGSIGLCIFAICIILIAAMAFLD